METINIIMRRSPSTRFPTVYYRAERSDANP